jgi:hypothetical protein
MTTHDELAYSVARQAVAEIRHGIEPWSTLFSTDAHVTASREWPVPDFVISDNANSLTIGAEFKPPGQTKREYLTGLGQALAYTRDFDYGLLVLPTVSDDQYRIADHVASVLDQPDYAAAPLGIMEYDPAQITPSGANASVKRFCARREIAPSKKALLGQTFYAKWREISPEEMACYLRCLYEEGLKDPDPTSSTRDRAFLKVWAEIQAETLHHWGGGVRHAKNGAKNRVAWLKNYRNFMSHVGWMESDGALTANGLKALHTSHIYGPKSSMFESVVAAAVLLYGKHLILINAIEDLQNEMSSRPGGFPGEAEWLSLIEEGLEDKGLLRRNPGRGAAAVAGSPRQFLKAEKQLWRQLGLIVPRGPRVFYPSRGFIFNWARVTEIVRLVG